MALRTTLITMIVTLGLLPATAMPARAQLQVSETGTPMINQNERHTGQSPLLGPTSPIFAWDPLQLYDKWTSAAVAGEGTPAAGTIYVGSGWSLCAVNPDGTNKWVNPNGAKCHLLQADTSVTDSPAIDKDGYIYMGARDNVLRAFRDNGPGTNPTQICTTDVHRDGDITGSPTIAPDGTVYFSFNFGGRLFSAKPARDCGLDADRDPVVLPAEGGPFKLNWGGSPFAAGADFAGSSPAIGSDGTVYIGSTNGMLHAVDPATGLERAGWPVRVGSMITNSSPSIGTDGTVYIGTVEGVSAVNPTGPTLLWSFHTLGRVDNTVVIGNDGTLYFGSRAMTQNTIYALNPAHCPAACTPVWTYFLSGGAFYSAFLTIGADNIIYAAIGFKLVALDAGGVLKPGWPYTFLTAVTSYPVLGGIDGNLYIGTKSGSKLYAFKGNGKPAPTPDLIETSVSTGLGGSPAVVNPGSSFPVNDTTTNQGTADAAASTTRYYLSLDGQKAGAIVLSGSREVPPLAKNTESVGSGTSVTVPADTFNGTYFLLACADDTLAVSELSETNNCGASSTKIQVQGGAQPLPDLVVTAVNNPPATVPVGGSLTATDTTTNQGTEDAAASTTGYYLSSDGILKSAPLTGSRPVPLLTAGSSSAGSASVTIPSNTPPGTYFLLACADNPGGVLESTDANNCGHSTASVLVTGLPNLIVTGVGPHSTTVALRNTFTVPTTITNSGSGTAAASRTQYYLGLNPQRSTGDRLLSGLLNVPSLTPSGTPGASFTGTATLTVPLIVPVATYYLFACADDLKVVKESNETDNCTASAQQVTVN